jgi:ribosomal protein S18 acetylase RimI-like enzyme
MVSSWFSRFYHNLKGPHPLHPDVIGSRLTPLTFRRYQQTDLDQCVELYAANEAGRFPEGVQDQYRKSLTRQSSYFLVLEHDGRIIASGGISLFLRPDVAVLCFGLVDPKHHGQGIGTALLLARLALLPGKCTYMVFIAAVEKSVGFYRRLGFRAFTPWKDTHGCMQPSGVLAFSPSEINRCRRLLAQRSILYPQDQEHIPFRAKSEGGESDVVRLG